MLRLLPLRAIGKPLLDCARARLVQRVDCLMFLEIIGLVLRANKSDNGNRSAKSIRS